MGERGRSPYGGYRAKQSQLARAICNDKYLVEKELRSIQAGMGLGETKPILAM